MTDWTTLHSIVLDECADAVEWCPLEPHTDILVCGTYQLLEDSRVRVGGVSVFRVKGARLEHVDRQRSAAVLDLKWADVSINSKAVLAAATAKGEICLYELTDAPKLISLESYSLRQKDTEGDLLALALAWNSDCDKLVASDSSGVITVLQLHTATHQPQLRVLARWLAHDLEAWTTAFHADNANVIYSGGDDCKLSVWDARCQSRSANCCAHEAGVTTLHSQPSGHLLSGSYDETIRLWDGRNWKLPLSKGSASGGVWRLRPEGKACTRPARYLAACVYGGAQVVAVHEAAQDMQVLAEYREHDSMCYGAHWQTNGGSTTLIATCSFYDKKLCISQWLPS